MSNNIKDFIELLGTYREVEDKERAEEIHEVLVRTIIDARFNGRSNNGEETHTAVSFAMDNRLVEIYNEMGKRRARGWKGRFLNRAVMNEMYKELLFGEPAIEEEASLENKHREGLASIQAEVKIEEE